MVVMLNWIHYLTTIIIDSLHKTKFNGSLGNFSYKAHEMCIVRTCVCFLVNAVMQYGNVLTIINVCPVINTQLHFTNNECAYCIF